MNLKIEYKYWGNIIHLRRIAGVWTCGLLKKDGSPCPGNSEVTLTQQFDPLFAEYYVRVPVRIKEFSKYFEGGIDDKYSEKLSRGICYAFRYACRGMNARYARDGLGLTQEGMAAVAGVSDRHIRMIETGEVHSLSYAMTLEALLRRENEWPVLEPDEEDEIHNFKIEPALILDHMANNNGMAVKAILSNP